MSPGPRNSGPTVHADGDDREPLMGLRRRPPAGDFPAAVGLPMILVLLASVVYALAGVGLAASSLTAAAVAFLLGAVGLVTAVGLARLRRWSWPAALGWGAMGTAAGMVLWVGLGDVRGLPVLPVLILLMVLRPAVRRALSL